jgi:hypothetical protein
MASSSGSLLVRFNRVFVWASLVLFVFFVFCGYGIVNPGLVGRLTVGVFDRDLSIYLHMTLTPYVLVVLLVHILIELRFVLIRWGVRQGKMLNGFIIFVGILVTAAIIMLQYAIV